MDSNDVGIAKWLMDHIDAILGLIATGFVGVLGWFIRDSRGEVKVEARLTAQEIALENAVKAYDLARIGLDARINVLGGEFRDSQERAARIFATREDLRQTEAHLNDTLHRMAESQSQLQQQITRLEERSGERFDKLYAAIIDHR